MKTLDIYAERRNYGRGVRIDILKRTRVGERPTHVAKPLEFRALTDEDEGAYNPESALSMSRDDAQALMDALWSCGLRPTEGEGSAGSLAATQQHLDDMRTVAFGALKKEGLL
jgi:hypothetical protein